MIVDVTDKLWIDKKSREWCKLPYSDHPKGCPNYGEKSECPPKAPFVEDFINLSKKHWFICEHFSLMDFENKMMKKHPTWTKKQARCCLYWQGTVRKKLNNYVKNFIDGRIDLTYTLIPEAMGVNVIKTAKRLNVPIKTKPDTYICKIALVGHKNNPNVGTIDYWINECEG